MMVPLAGGTATLQSGAVAANGLATYDGNVYWTGLQMDGIPSVMMIPVAGNGWNVLAYGFANAAIAVGPKGVYGTGPVVGGTTIVSAPMDGGPATSIVPPEDLPQPFACNGLAVDATSLYWTSASDPCTVMRVALDGGSPIKLGSAPGGGFGIAVDASNVYWVTTQAVTKVPVEGGDAVTLAATGAGA